MTNGRVVLFDLHADGHHIKYVRYVAQHLLEEGNKVAFVTMRRARSIDLLLGDLPLLRIEYLGTHEGKGLVRDLIRMLVEMWRVLGRCYSFADAWDATHVCLMMLDHSEPVVLLRTLSWRRRKWRLAGFLVWPYMGRSRSGRGSLIKRVYRRFRRDVLRVMLRWRLIDGVFVTAEWTRQSCLRRRGQDRRVKSGITVVPEPCDPVEIVPTMIEARKCLSLPMNRCMILFFGGLRWDKGIDILLDALNGLEENVVLVIAGPADYLTEADINKRRGGLRGPADLIARIGYITPEDERLYYAAADAVILPYRHAFRGTSGVLQTAASFGKPLIASDVGEVGRLVRENGLGIVVEPESLLALQHGIQQFARMCREISSSVQKAAADYAAAHHWSRMAELVTQTMAGGLD